MGLALLSTIAFASGMGVVRHLSADMHTFQIAFFSSLFGLFAMLPWGLRYGLRPLRTDKFWLHVVRGVLSVIGIWAVYYALSVTPIATVTALNFMMPILTTLLAVFLLKERGGSGQMGRHPVRLRRRLRHPAPRNSGGGTSVHCWSSLRRCCSQS